VGWNPADRIGGAAVVDKAVQTLSANVVTGISAACHVDADVDTTADTVTADVDTRSMDVGDNTPDATASETMTTIVTT